MRIEKASRDIRRKIFAIERIERASGKWGPWRRTPIPLGLPLSSPGSWCADVREVVQNDWIVILIRPNIPSALGPIDHAAIRTAMNAELGWKELQRLKDEVFGSDRMAVQVYPRAADLIDAADMYHLWVFREGFRFDFGLARGQL